MRDLNFWKEKLVEADKKLFHLKYVLSLFEMYKSEMYNYKLPRVDHHSFKKLTLRRKRLNKRLSIETKIGGLNREIKQLSETKIPYFKGMIEKLEA